MCLPGAEIALMGFSLLGGGIGAAGSMHSGEQRALGYEDEAAFADRQAILEGQAGAYERDRLRTRNDRLLGDVRQQFISSGIDASSGSAQEVVADSAREAALDEEAIIHGAQLRAENNRYSARLARRNASAARTGAVFEAAGSLVSGAAGVTRTMLSNPYTQYKLGSIY